MRRIRSKDVLVTGGTGFVGSHLVELLISKGYNPVCLVRDPQRLRWLEGLDVRIVQGDCSEPETLPPAVEGVSVVFHVAGLTKAGRSSEYYKVNHIGTRNLLEACAKYNPDLARFILVSSLAAAGPSPDGRPVTETDPPRPVSDYGRSKVMAEQTAMEYKDIFPVVILRPSAVYGPRDTDMFEFFRLASKGFALGFSGGERFINPCYVADLAEALLLAAERDVRSGSIYFVAEPRTYSWTEIGDEISGTGGVTVRHITIPAWVGYVIAFLAEIKSFLIGRPSITNRQKVREALQRYWICDTSGIENDLGFKSAYPFSLGSALTWKWYRDNGWL